MTDSYPYTASGPPVWGILSYATLRTICFAVL